jgi:hypothetical protein
MIRLTNDDSLPRVDEAVDRHIRLCAQTKGAKKYEDIIKPLYTEFQTKMMAYRAAQRTSSATLDTIKLKNSVLDDTLRDAQGRVKEYDRNNPGSNQLSVIFPEGVSAIVTMPDKDEPAAAEAIAKKIVSLGQQNELFPLVAKIEAAVRECQQSFEQQLVAQKAEGDANTDLVITKLKLVRQYNANYFLAASDVDKAYAEKLFPDIRPSKKEASADHNEVKAA